MPKWLSLGYTFCSQTARKSLPLRGLSLGCTTSPVSAHGGSGEEAPGAFRIMIQWSDLRGAFLKGIEEVWGWMEEGTFILEPREWGYVLDRKPQQTGGTSSCPEKWPTFHLLPETFWFLLSPFGTAPKDKGCPILLGISREEVCLCCVKNRKSPPSLLLRWVFQSNFLHPLSPP